MSEGFECFVMEDLQDIRDAGMSWDELRKLINTLEENEAEASGERHFTEPGAWRGGVAKNN